MTLSPKITLGKKFAAGCDREVIKRGAEMLGWEMDELFEQTILAMRVDEDAINAYEV